MENKRLTAIKVAIDDIIDGNYHKQEGFEPSFIITPSGKKVSRARVLGTIVNKYESPDKKFSSITVDDASATIRAKSFGSDLFEKVGLGDIVDIIGRVRVYENETHLVAEIVNKMDDPNYELLRKLELMLQEREWNEKKKQLLELKNETTDLSELKQAAASQLHMDADVVEAIVSGDTEMEEAAFDENKDELKKKMLDLIEKCDTGNGCSYNDLVSNSGVDENIVESIVSELLEDGECFEPKPGKIKRL